MRRYAADFEVGTRRTASGFRMVDQEASRTETRLERDDALFLSDADGVPEAQGREAGVAVDRSRRREGTRVLFVIPPNNTCAGPLDEIVFMLETHLRRVGAREPVDIVWATAEQGFIQAFGPTRPRRPCRVSSVSAASRATRRSL